MKKLFLLSHLEPSIDEHVIFERNRVTLFITLENKFIRKYYLDQQFYMQILFSVLKIPKVTN